MKEREAGQASLSHARSRIVTTGPWALSQITKPLTDSAHGPIRRPDWAVQRAYASYRCVSETALGRASGIVVPSSVEASVRRVASSAQTELAAVG